MKIVWILIVGYFSISLSVAENDMPREVKLLLDKRDNEIAKINAAHTKELESLKAKYMRSGNLENANLVNSLILQTQTIMLDGEWRVYAGGKYVGVRQFKGEVMIDERGGKHKWTFKRGILKIDWGRGRFEQFKVSARVPDALVGPNDNGTMVKYVKVK